MSLAHGRVETRLPAKERDGGLRYECDAGVFCLFESAGSSAGSFTQMGFAVGIGQAIR